MQNEHGDLNMKLNRLLMQYRKLMNSTTRNSSAELMFDQPIRTRLDLIKRNITKEMIEKSTAHHVKIRKFKVGDNVQIKSYSNPRVK
jgi:hypothetical protein